MVFHPPPVEYKGTLTEWQLLSSTKRYEIRNRDKILARRKERRADNSEWAVNKREKTRVYLKQYNKDNAEKLAEKAKIYRIKNRDHIALNISEYSKVYRNKNKEKIAARQKAYQDKNRVRIAQRNKEWYNRKCRMFNEMFDGIY
jgi:hypothetical protein